MTTRRLITAPLVAFAVALLVVAIVQAGERSRAQEPTVPHGDDRAVDVAEELARIDEARRSETRCGTVADCDPLRRGPRLRRAAAGIERWPPAARFHTARAAFEQELLARAALVEQQAMMQVDDATSRAETARLRQLHDAWVAAARHALDAQLVAGIVDRDAHRAGRAELADSVREQATS